ncbi:hypothetical protein SUGI_1127880 [Cryptomeria japonica]|nr:hypothetical protein SUGI_1127880 [Cryptomeria japonica]
MGGLGKTMLAKEIYNKRSSSIDSSSFIVDIREAKCMLEKKQIELLKGLGVDKSIDNVEQGKAILARILGSSRVLIVMDGVDHVDQLDALIPAKELEREVSSLLQHANLKCLIRGEKRKVRSLKSSKDQRGVIINYANKKERRNGIRGITTITTGMEELLSYREEVAPYLAALKLLVMRGDYFNQIINEVWLRWSEIGQRNLPPQHSLKNLRVLQLEGGYFGKTHLEELWEAESDAPLQLRELVISNCYNFQRLPNSIGCLIELKKIAITGSSNVRSLPEEIFHLQLLSISHYRGCGDLILRSDDFQNITKLEFLDLSGCNQLEELPRPITNQVFLREFYLDDLQRLREIKIGQLSRLQKMVIRSIEGCTRMEKLALRTCWEVSSIGNLERMRKLKEVELRANKGSAIGRSIRTIQNCPDAMIIYAGTVPDASSLVDSFKLGLSPNLSVVDSFSNKDISSKPELHSPISTAIMLCFIVDAASSLILSSVFEEGNGYSCVFRIGEGRWSLIAVFT